MNRNFCAAVCAGLVMSVATWGTDAGMCAEKPLYEPHVILVKFKPGTDAVAKQAVCAQFAATVEKRYPLTGIEKMRLGSTVDPARVAATMAASVEVMYAQPNYIHHECRTPNDDRYAALWGLDNHGQTYGKPDADIDAAEAWNITTGTNVVVAVIDSGVQYTHPDLAANMWRNPGEIPTNGIDDDANGYVDDVYGVDAVNNDGDPMDDRRHGSHCAGTIAAVGNNGIGVAGVCWNARIMACKFLDANGQGTTADAIECIEYATRMGARVMNNSWGDTLYEQALYDAVELTRRSNIVFVAAAGNEQQDNDINPLFPASFTNDNIIAVAASDDTDKLVFFSCYGLTSVDLAAPGLGILSTVPTNDYEWMSGTSMATPHVAGAAALLLAADPGLDVAQVKAALLASADPDPSLAGKCVSGGRLNVFNALLRTAGTLGTLTGVVRDAFSGAGIAGAHVAASNGFDVCTDSNGAYAVSVLSGSYSIAATEPGSFLPAPPQGVTIAKGATSALDFVLASFPMRVTPATGMTSRGAKGGPFAPTATLYTVLNVATTTLAWSLHGIPAWLGVNMSSGTLAAGVATNVVLSVSPAATTLFPGTYAASLVFSNHNSGETMCRPARLTVTPLTVLEEHFDSGLPAGWQAVGNVVSGCVWRFDDPMRRWNRTGGDGLFAIGDSDYATEPFGDTELRTRPIDCSGLKTAGMSFNQDFYCGAETADVDVCVNGTAGPWQNVLRQTSMARGPTNIILDLSGVAAGKSNIVVRFRYYNVVMFCWWQVDDVAVFGSLDLPPYVDITNALAEVDTAIPHAVAGTNNDAVVGFMWISNAANSHVSSFPASPGWVSPAIAIEPGTNIVHVFGSNLVAQLANDTVVVVGVPEATVPCCLALMLVLRRPGQFRRAP